MYLLTDITTRYATAYKGDKVEIITDSHYPVILCKIDKQTFPVTIDELSIKPVAKSEKKEYDKRPTPKVRRRIL